ncbi:MAG: glycosyltransferase family 2 protein, partial [Candidatus Roizmanbacteria bacterium]|nr:glycosyltransferase family 2 protein [Candidatus Roizmanbacteria bacterium]
MIKFSIIIPLYNEEVYLKKQIITLIQKLNYFGFKNNYEILLIENGSKDKTYKIARELSENYNQLRVYKQNKPCYGLALKEGIKKARFNNIIQFDVDFTDANFLKKSLKLIKKFDIIIGSKLHSQSKDARPRLRIVATKIINLFVKLLFNYQGTDTHGIKAYKKNKIYKIINKVKTTHHFFETELILRATKNNFKIAELPVRIKELRPTRFPTLIRLVEAVREIFLL